MILTIAEILLPFIVRAETVYSGPGRGAEKHKSVAEDGSRAIDKLAKAGQISKTAAEQTRRSIGVGITFGHFLARMFGWIHTDREEIGGLVPAAPSAGADLEPSPKNKTPESAPESAVF